VRTVVRLLVLAGIVAVAIGVTAAGASAGKVHKQALYVRTVPTSSFYVDNDPSGNSAGDLFGSTGDLRRSGRKLGTYSSACTAASDSLGQCHATFVFRGGDRLQLAGQFDLSPGVENQLSIVGGTGKYKRAGGEAHLKPATRNPSIQKVRLRIRL
jgi:Dirigent-like protein